MSNINYNKDKVEEGLSLLKEYTNDIEKAKELLDAGFSMIKSANGYLEIKPRLLIKQSDVDANIQECLLAISDLISNIVLASELIKEFDENDLERITETKPKLNYSVEEITEEDVKSSIENSFSNNKKITNMFKMDLYNNLKSDLQDLNEQGNFTTNE